MKHLGVSTPLSEIENRIERLQEKMLANDVDAAIIIQNADLFYFTGTIQRSHLYVPAEGRPLLMVRKSIDRAMKESPLRPLIHLSSPRWIFDMVSEHGLPRPTTIGMELDVLPVNLFLYYKRVFDRVRIVDISGTIRRLRAVKSDHEVKLIRSACQRADQIAALVPDILRIGMREVALAAHIEGESRRLGHHGITRIRNFNAEVFYGHLMSGPSGAVASFLDSPTGGMGMCAALAQSAGKRRIRQNEPVMVDYVFGWRGYLADHARVYSLGRLDSALEKAHEVLLEVQTMLMDEGMSGTVCEELYMKASAILEKNRLRKHFMGHGADTVNFVGHGIGLEIDELPVLGKGQKIVLEENMIVALEPKAVFPGKGVVGIENMFRVTEGGLERLTWAADNIRSVEV